MRIEIDDKKKTLVVDGMDMPLYSNEAYKLISDIWLKVGWDQKHLYTFSWLGRPIIQEPEDMIRMQEVLYTIQPDVIIETGVAHGGSIILYASICKMIGKGKVVGVDIEIRPHNRKAIEEHEMFDKISLIEGDSNSQEILDEVGTHIQEGDTVLVILDSCHDYDHVKKELEQYSKFVSAGSYIVCTDGLQKTIGDTDRAIKEYPEASGWYTNNPLNALREFVEENENFVIEEPKFPFSESEIDYRLTHWPEAYLKRVK